jgi:hypothetical protein
MLAVVLFSCEEPVKIDVGQTPSKIVIEGLLTNKSGMQSIKITRTADFYASGTTPRVTDAVVTVTDDLGEVVNFTHNPNNHPDSAGIYIPPVEFAGAIGRTYHMKVQIGDELYEAQDELFEVIPIDSLGFQVNKLEQEDPSDPGKFYELLMFAHEPQDEKNFYLFKFYRNDSLVFDNDTDIYYSDDELLAENIDGVPSPVFFGKDDKGRVEIYSISRVGFVYFNDLWSLLNNDSGGMFGPIPASPRTNLTNGALGFFQVSAMHTAEVKVE